MEISSAEREKLSAYLGGLLLDALENLAERNVSDKGLDTPLNNGLDRPAIRDQLGVANRNFPGNLISKGYFPPPDYGDSPKNHRWKQETVDQWIEDKHPTKIAWIRAGRPECPNELRL